MQFVILINLILCLTRINLFFIQNFRSSTKLFNQTTFVFYHLTSLIHFFIINCSFISRQLICSNFQFNCFVILLIFLILQLLLLIYKFPAQSMVVIFFLWLIRVSWKVLIFLISPDLINFLHLLCVWFIHPVLMLFWLFIK